ncbi:hypothetical protein QOT17_014043 [Balamuthia mandrillaris]
MTLPVCTLSCPQCTRGLLHVFFALYEVEIVRSCASITIKHKTKTTAFSFCALTIGSLCGRRLHKGEGGIYIHICIAPFERSISSSCLKKVFATLTASEPIRSVPTFSVMHEEEEREANKPLYTGRRSPTLLYSHPCEQRPWQSTLATGKKSSRVAALVLNRHPEP